MDKEAFINTAISIYGIRGWQTQLARDLDVNVGTVQRYKQGKRTIPRVIALAMDGIKARREASK